jgi:alkylation response protein AidB-like acyl-CoA dehydrogenase
MKYLDVFLKEEDYMLKDMFRSFVDNEIMPVRQQIDDDKDHKIVNKILQGLTDLGVQRSAFPEEYGGGCVWQVKNDEFGNQKVQSIAITLGNFAPSKLRGNYSSPYL